MRERSQHFQPENGYPSVQILRYRGVFYLREQRLSSLKLTSTEVGHLPNNSSTQLDVNQRGCEMYRQRMGFLYKFYCMGWKNGSLKCFPAFQHWLLSIFFYYRIGFSEGSQWRQQHHLARLESEMMSPCDRDF